MANKEFKDLNQQALEEPADSARTIIEDDTPPAEKEIHNPADVTETEHGDGTLGPANYYSEEADKNDPKAQKAAEQEKKVVALEAKAIAIEADLQELRQQTAACETEAAKREETATGLEADAAGKEKTAGALEAELASKRSTAAQLETDAANLEKQAAGDAENTRLEAIRAEAAIPVAVAEAETAATQAADAAALAEEITAQAQAALARANDAETEAALVGARAEAAASAAREAGAKVLAAMGELDAAKAAMDAAVQTPVEGENSTPAEPVSSAELAAATEKVDALSAEAEKALQAAQPLQAEYEVAQASAAEVTAMAEAAHVRAEEAKAAAEAKRAASEDAAKNIEATKANAEAAKQAAEQARLYIDTAKAEAEAMRAQAQQLLAESAGVEEQALAARATASEARAEADKARAWANDGAGAAKAAKQSENAKAREAGQARQSATTARRRKQRQDNRAAFFAGRFWQNFCRPVIALAAICIVVSALLAFTNEMTAPIIEENTAAAANETRQELLPAADSFEDAAPAELPEGVVSVFKAANGAGYVIEASAAGYGGQVPAMVAFDEGGSIVGVKFLENDETPGLGQKVVSQESFAAQFAGRAANPIGNNDIDKIASATISSNAALNAVNAAIDYYALEVLGEAGGDMTDEEVRASLLPGAGSITEMPVEETGVLSVWVGDDGNYIIYGAAPGIYGAVVTAAVAMDENGTVLAVWLDTEGQTPGYGAELDRDQAFIEGFTGATSADGVDGVAGATITSDAAKEAVQNALDALETVKGAA